MNGTNKPGQQGTSGNVPGQEPTGGGASPEEQFLEIEGEKVPMNDVIEWKKGGLRQEDYTRKTQELAKDKEQFNKDYEQVVPLLELQAFLRQNPDKAAKIAQILSVEGGVPTGGASTGDTPNFMQRSGLDPVAAVKQELAAIKQQLAHQQQTSQDQDFNRQVDQAHQDLETELAGLAKQYPYMRDTEVLAQLLGNPEANVEDLAKASHESVTKMREDFIKDYTGRKKKQAKEIVQGKGGNISDIIETKDLKLQDGSARKAAANYLRKVKEALT